VVVTLAVDVIDFLSIVEAMDAKPTLEHLSEAIDSLACDKASDDDGSPLLRRIIQVRHYPIRPMMLNCLSNHLMA